MNGTFDKDFYNEVRRKRYHTAASEDCKGASIPECSRRHEDLVDRRDDIQPILELPNIGKQC